MALATFGGCDLDPVFAVGRKHAVEAGEVDPPAGTWCRPGWCSDCHGADRRRLHLPTPVVCGGCHERQHEAFTDEARYGFPSHPLAMQRAVDAKHFVDKPKAEV